MDAKLLSRIDLNLLVALQMLLEEKSVTRAAERLFITQPAMSKTLLTHCLYVAVGGWCQHQRLLSWKSACHWSCHPLET